MGRNFPSISSHFSTRGRLTFCTSWSPLLAPHSQWRRTTTVSDMNGQLEEGELGTPGTPRPLSITRFLLSNSPILLKVLCIIHVLLSHLVSRVSWVRIPPRAAFFPFLWKKELSWVVLNCLPCLCLVASFSLSYYLHSWCIILALQW